MKKKCYRCGACCIGQGFGWPVEKNDLRRWIKQKRVDILSHLKIYLDDKNKLRGDALKENQIDSAKAWLWYTPGGRKLYRCPFLRKDRNKSTYKCLINKTKPDRCREFKGWESGILEHQLGVYQCCKNIKHEYSPLEVYWDENLGRFR